MWMICLILLLIGNLHAGRALSLRDMPTQYGARISGTVSAIESAYRVYLTDVEADGEKRFSRDVVVTLMTQEEKTPPAVCVGQRVCGTGRLFAPEEVRNPGGVSRRVQSLSKGYELSGYILPGWTAQGKEVFSLREGFRRARLAVLERIDRVFGDAAPLFQGILLGVRDDMDTDAVRAMRLTGTVHILAVSGMHLSLIAMTAYALLRRLPIEKKLRYALFSLFLIGFTCLTGGAAGTVRACIMAMMRALASLRGRKYDGLTALSAAALLMMTVNPVWALNASFQFSFFVVLGIQLLAGAWRAQGKKKWDWLRGSSVLRAASFSAAAQISAVPMQLLLYGFVPLLALPMNLLVSAGLPVLLIGGWLCVLAGAVCAPLAAVPADVLSQAAALFEALSLRAAAIPGGIVRLPSPKAATVLLFACMLMMLSRRIRFGRLRRTAAAVLAVLTLASYLPRFDPGARYVQLDVGQGDAALFRAGRHAVLVDVGPADSYDMLRYLRSEGLFVNAVILSHPDEDHAGALGTLLDSEVMIPAVILAREAEIDGASDVVRVILQALEEGRALHRVKTGDRIAFDELTLDVLAPDDAPSGSNERSLLLHAQMESVNLLLTGDLPAACEPESVPACDVLKVAHHGSANATSDAFLDMARPEFGLISVGAGNRYGHPSARVTDALGSRGVHILRTDRDGCITLRLDDGDVRESVFIRR